MFLANVFHKNSVNSFVFFVSLFSSCLVCCESDWNKIALVDTPADGQPQRQEEGCEIYQEQIRAQRPRLQSSKHRPLCQPRDEARSAHLVFLSLFFGEI